MKAPVQLVLLVVVLAAAALAWAQAPAKPVSEQDLVTMLGLGLDAETIVARIKKTGIAFDANAQTLQKLKTAGATDPLLDVVRQEGAKARPAVGAAPAGAVTYDQVLQMLSLGIDENGILARLSRSPTTFTLSAEQVAALKQAGASEKVLSAMQGLRAASAKSSDITDLAIILDCSGSMKELTTGRETKMVAAKRVVSDLVNKIPEGLNVTFVLYGHEVFGGAEDPRNCQAVKVARPLSPLDASGKAELTQLISRLQPIGSTPIALSLRTAGQELAKNSGLCGVVLITDGVETCNGDPAAEAAALAANLKLTFGVNVVGFGVKPEENASLKKIADAGRGKYYSAADANQLAQFVSTIAREIEQAAKPPETVVGSRRAVQVVQPEIELLPMKEILLAETDAPKSTLDGYVKAKTDKYGEEIRIPSATAKYDLWWVPKQGHVIRMVKGISFPERKVVKIKPEDYLGLIQVKGTGTVKEILAVPAGSPASTRHSYTTQDAKKYGDIMIVPTGKYDIWVDSNVIEEGLNVAAGKLHSLE
jgi:Mg-chelatase subunit ChlD